MKFTALRVLVFKSLVCPACATMQKKKVIEKFVDRNFPPKITVQWLDCLDANGEFPEGTEFEKNYNRSDGYGVNAFPTVIIEGKRKDGGAYEVARMDSDTVSDFSTQELNRVFKEGMKQLEEAPDEMMTQDQAAASIPWS